MVKAFVRQFPLAPTHVDMKPIFAVFVNICLLRRGPELVPTHPLFVGAVVTTGLLVSLVNTSRRLIERGRRMLEPRFAR